MTPEPAVRTRLARLLRELDLDRGALVGRSEEVGSLLSAWGGGESVDRLVLYSMTLQFHGWYTAFETLCERVARLLDEEVPTGANWPADLLSQMQGEVPGLRPALVPAHLAPDLHELRKFRHFFRNAYTLDFEPSLVRVQAERLRGLHPLVVASLDALAAHLHAVLGIQAAD